jgi:hypothetical protein
METKAFDLLLLPLLQWFVVTFASMALVRAVLVSAARWWESPIDEESDACFKSLHRGE